MEQLPGHVIIASLKECDVKTIISVPDIYTSDGLLWPLADDPDLRLLRICREEEGIGISAGLSFCGHRSVLLIQNTGLLASINGLRSVVEYGLPTCLVIGLLAKPPGIAPSKAPQYGVRIVEPILDAMGIENHVIDTTADVPLIPEAINKAYDTSQPVALLLGRSPSAP